LSKSVSEEWLYTISSKRGVLNLNFKEIWSYRDLLLLFVKRDVVTLYKQTILGPLWYFIQPLFTSVVFTLIFNNLANIPTGEGVPAFLFNLAGITAWNYFKLCLTGTSNTFTKNQGIFGKVYFPRAIIPLSVVISNLLRFTIQCTVFVGFYIYYILAEEVSISPNWSLLLLPIVVLMMALLGLGFGMLISSMTTKYRDLTYLVQFGVQLLMYGSAVMYPISYFRKELPKYVWLVEYNPIANIIESFRHMTLGIEILDVNKFIYTVVFSIVIFMLGLVVFNKTEKSFIDTV
tara:strand:- start:158 stop:1027 length:870 start_codon:yes stop_codon:yes gene_type:complete